MSRCARARGWQPRDLAARLPRRRGARCCSCAPRRCRAARFSISRQRGSPKTPTAGAVLIVNDRADIAVLVGPGRPRRPGRSDPARRAARRRHRTRSSACPPTPTRRSKRRLREPISYLAIGPVFGRRRRRPATTRLDLRPWPTASRRAAAAGLPVVAIGGITLDTAPRGDRGRRGLGRGHHRSCSRTIPSARVRQYLVARSVSDVSTVRCRGHHNHASRSCRPDVTSGALYNRGSAGRQAGHSQRRKGRNGFESIQGRNRSSSSSAMPNTAARRSSAVSAPGT